MHNTSPTNSPPGQSPYSRAIPTKSINRLLHRSRRSSLPPHLQRPRIPRRQSRINERTCPSPALFSRTDAASERPRSGVCRPPVERGHLLPGRAVIGPAHEVSGVRNVPIHFLVNPGAVFIEKREREEGEQRTTNLLNGIPARSPATVYHAMR